MLVLSNINTAITSCPELHNVKFFIGENCFQDPYICIFLHLYLFTISAVCQED